MAEKGTIIRISGLIATGQVFSYWKHLETCLHDAQAFTCQVTHQFLLHKNPLSKPAPSDADTWHERDLPEPDQKGNILPKNHPHVKSSWTRQPHQSAASPRLDSRQSKLWTSKSSDPKYVTFLGR